DDDVVFCLSSRRRHTRLVSDWSSDVCSSDLGYELRKEDIGNADDRRAQGQRQPSAEQASAAEFHRDAQHHRARREENEVVRRVKIGRASCRERVWSSGVAGALKTKTMDEMGG